LLHKIPIGLVESFRLYRHPLLAPLIIIFAAYVLAALSWNLLEKPFLRLKRHFEPKPIFPDRVNT